MHILVTGGAGFIGSHLIEHIIRTTEWTVVCVDKLSYATKGWKRLQESNCYYSPRLKCLTWDLETALSQGMIEELGDVNVIIHMAAETHVDDSIRDPVGTVRNNVMSTVHVLEYARTLKNLKTFQYFSTDETFGAAPVGVDYKESDAHAPSNPYSASKAASEDICLAYRNTYGIPLIVTNLMNVFGERQHVQKYIPLVIKKVLNDEVVDIHTESDGVTPGSRHYIHARNVSAAVLFILDKGIPGERYNIKGEREVNNLDLAQSIAKIIGKELEYKLVKFAENRPGHDIRYSLDGTKLFEMGWRPPVDFDHSLEKTVKWTLQHPQWLEQ
jgi:dTDP-glucose 4,6-dehydratase